jgi:hypothetical protein
VFRPAQEEETALLERRITSLTELYKKGLIEKDEFNAGRNQIIRGPRFLS